MKDRAASADTRRAARPNRTRAETNGAYWLVDIAGSIDYAATKFRQREGVKVTYDAYRYIDLISGHELQLTNPDQSRTSVGIYLHENRLYILEATVPPRAPQPGIFQISLRFLDKDLRPVRYQWVGTQLYSNGSPPPPRARGGQQGQQQQQQGR